MVASFLAKCRTLPVRSARLKSLDPGRAMCSPVRVISRAQADGRRRRPSAVQYRAVPAAAVGLLLLTGCGASANARHRRTGGGSAKGIPRALLAGMRPIGRGARFQPPDRGPILGSCSLTLGARIQVHIEVFGANRVVLLPAGLGTLAPRRFSNGRLVRARCFGAVVTLDRTGVVYVRSGTRLTLGDLFRSWGQKLSEKRVASFGGRRVDVYVDGSLRHGAASAVPLRPDAEIVVEVGPHVPPHHSFVFLPLPARTLG